MNMFVPQTRLDSFVFLSLVMKLVTDISFFFLDQNLARLGLAFPVHKLLRCSICETPVACGVMGAKTHSHNAPTVSRKFTCWLC